MESAPAPTTVFNNNAPGGGEVDDFNVDGITTGTPWRAGQQCDDVGVMDDDTIDAGGT